MVKNITFISIIILLCAFHVSAQTIKYDTFGKGLQITSKDSTSSLKFSARFQTLYFGVVNLDNNNYTDNLLVRRMRLKFDGHALTPKLVYKLELGFSNRDQSGGDIPESSNTPRIILDAVAKYNFAKNWYLWFGQTKLPGNRERIISSQKLQHVDRSILNSRFTTDRDIGIQLWRKTKYLSLVGAISKGEGRDVTVSNKGGYEYSFKVEVYPFGSFKSGGDYSGADLVREEKPKLAIAASFDQNNDAARIRGNTGFFLDTRSDLRSYFVDAIFKFKGFSAMVEYATKEVSDGELWGVTDEGDSIAFMVGNAINLSSGYIFDNNIEISGRYTKLNADKNLDELDQNGISVLRDNNQYTLGVSKYFRNHSLKVQSDITYIERPVNDNQLLIRMQLEIAL